MGAVAGLHVGALYLIATGLGVVPSLLTEPVVPATVINEEITPVDPPERVTPQTHEPDITVPRPLEPDFAPPDTTNDRIIGVATDDPIPIPDPVPQPGPDIVGVRLDSRFPLTQPPYPAIDTRHGNEGFVDLEIQVMPNGRVGDVRVLKSTGFPTLDQSAVNEAKRKWKFLPATRDGVAFAQWHKLRVVFKLENR